MIVKIVGFIAFLFVIFFKHMYYSAAWWDRLSLLITLGGSIAVWILYFFLKRKWDFFARNISIFLGIAYGFIWGIELMVTNHASLIFPLVTVPIGYGLFISIISNYIYERAYRDEKDID